MCLCSCVHTYIIIVGLMQWECCFCRVFDVPTYLQSRLCFVGCLRVEGAHSCGLGSRVHGCYIKPSWLLTNGVQVIIIYSCYPPSPRPDSMQWAKLETSIHWTENWRRANIRTFVLAGGDFGEV